MDWELVQGNRDWELVQAMAWDETSLWREISLSHASVPIPECGIKSRTVFVKTDKMWSENKYGMLIHSPHKTVVMNEYKWTEDRGKLENMVSARLHRRIQEHAKIYAGIQSSSGGNTGIGDRQTNTQTNRQTDRQTDRQIDR